MQFVKLSDTCGINLDHIIAWADVPEQTYRSGLVCEPHLLLQTLGTSSAEDCGAVPHQIYLEGEDRVKMLHLLDAVTEKEDWKAAYEETRDEARVVENRLFIYRKNVSEEQRQRIEDEIDIEEGVHAARD